ncbi:olfactory receptor 6P1-like [Rhinophrynus dorsalis]
MAIGYFPGSTSICFEVCVKEGFIHMGDIEAALVMSPFVKGPMLGYGAFHKGDSHLKLSNNLNLPMYSFLKHLALVDILFTTNIFPYMLHIILMEGGRISKSSCIFQYYVHSISIYTQSLIITVMAFDRYLAICHPLRYSSVMDHKRCFHLIFWSWAAGFLLIPSEFILVSKLQFCGPNIIDHFFCDIDPILEMSSSSYTGLVKWEDFALSVLLLFLPSLFVIASYIFIFITIFKISSAAGRKKAFSICSSHLATVCTYYGSILTIYIFTAGEKSLNENKMRSLIYTILTPFFNPIIYSMRNQEIRRAFQKLICKKGFNINT